ncbi:MAG: aldose 1-epimerase [Planctomycetota bacterium]|nr:MAG: aldose 1-epimerase [Planctomycetota bacterium]REK38474.1 MAG: aldose 1-epimerase [Planctomycetota bacterium]
MTPVTITAAATGATAEILPELGFNCYSFRVQRGGEPIELLWAAEGFREGGERPSGSGIPILFPFPGRIGQGRFRYGGREYSLEVEEGREHALHGFAYTRPWRVLERASDRVTAQFTASIDDPTILDRWPADFQITASYRIEQEELVLDIKLENPGQTSCPWGLGLHPYFRVPIDSAAGDGRAGRAAECELQVPVAKAWELDAMLPTGKILAATEIEGMRGEDLRTGVTLGDRHLDDVFTGVEFVDGVATSRLRDPQSGHAIAVRFDDTFRECVLYTPDTREAVCIEPYTCVPDAYALAERGIETESIGTGLRLLEPGQSVEAWMRVGLA